MARCEAKRGKLECSLPKNHDGKHSCVCRMYFDADEYAMLRPEAPIEYRPVEVTRRG